MNDTERRRFLLQAIENDTFDETLRWLIHNGLVVFILTADSVQFRVTPRGRLWLAGAETFHPSGNVPA